MESRPLNTSIYFEIGFGYQATIRGTVKISTSLEIGFHLPKDAYITQLSHYGMIHLPKNMSYRHLIASKTTENASKELDFQTHFPGRTAMLRFDRPVGFNS